MNALAAAAIATALDVPLATIRAGLESAPAVAGRLVRRKHASGAMLIDDSYNANPGSFAAAIATLAAESGETILVMGDMAELGADAERLHAEIGALAKRSGVKRLHAVGRLSRAAATAFGAGAMHHVDQAALIACAARRSARRCDCADQGFALVGDGPRRQPRCSTTATEASVMLLELADLLKGYVSGFHLFQYLTFRTIMSTLTALAVSLLAGPAIIRKLAAVKAGQVIRSDGPQSHLTKAGTPTMGGALILGSIVAATLLWADLRNRYVWLVLGVTLAFGAIGFYDDYKKLILKDSRGLAARWKYFWQSRVRARRSRAFLYFTADTPAATTLYLPLIKQARSPLGVARPNRAR